MKRIPFTRATIITDDEATTIADTLDAASEALEASAKANMELLTTHLADQAKLRELAGLLVQQSEGVQQIMQVNLLVSGALGQIREGADVDETCVALEAALQEFDSGAALA